MDQDRMDWPSVQGHGSAELSPTIVSPFDVMKKLSVPQDDGSMCVVVSGSGRLGREVPQSVSEDGTPLYSK